MTRSFQDDLVRIRARAEHQCASLEDACTGCEVCTKRCALLADRGWDIRAVCREVRRVMDEAAEGLERAQAKGETLWSFVLSCAGCNHCTASCPQGLEMGIPWGAGRELARASGRIDDADVQIVKVDCTWDSFSIFRAAQGIDYADLPLLRVEPIDALQTGWTDPNAGTFDETPRAKTLFFPGCSLATYAPGLARAAFAWLSESRGECLLATQCCGVTLSFMGETERATAWKVRVIEAARAQGVECIVCVCPGCAVALASVAADVAPEIEFVSLASLLVNAGVRVDASALGEGETPVMVVDSCNDRACVHGDAIRQLFAGVDSVLSPCRGADARCCGAGGGVNLFDAPRARERTRRMMAMAHEHGACTVVTACPTCAYTYSFERWESALEGDESVARLGVLNYLEAVFGQRIDWDATFQALVDTWSNPAAS